MNKPIDEPSFTPPPFRKSEPKSPGSSSGSSSSKQQSKEDPLNPEMSNLNKKDTKMAATAAADMLLSGYETLHVFANKALQIPQKKLKKMEADGLINLNAMIEYDYNHTITAGEFINNYNEQVSNLLTVSDEFKDEVRPLLVEAFQKRGIGLTDEQYLMYLFGKDIAGKSIIFFQQRQQMNYMLQTIKEATISQQSFSQPRPTPQQAPSEEPTPRERERRQPDPTPKSKSVKGDGNYTLFPLFETDEEINNRETEKDNEEDEYIFNSKRKNATDNIIIEPMPKRKVGRPKK
jgi:hypothetical protein